MLDQIPSEAQIQLIQSLDIKLQEELLENENLRSKNKVPTQYRCSRGSIIDNLRMIKQYICSCGKQTSTLSHVTKTETNGSAQDIYHLNCQSCHEEQKISFVMLRQSLLGNSTQIPVKERSIFYPYV